MRNQRQNLSQKLRTLIFLIAAPYWCTDKGFVSTSNEAYHVEQLLTITVILLSAGRARSHTHSHNPQSVRNRVLNINEVLASYGKQFTAGAAEIKYKSTHRGCVWREPHGLNAHKSLIFNFQFRLPELTPRREGSWCSMTTALMV